MKTITLDYETYENELNKSFKAGQELHNLALKEANTLIKRVTDCYIFSPSEIHKNLSDWLHRYSDKDV